MNDAVLWMLLAAAIIVALLAEFCAWHLFKAAERRDDFDGGFRHENEPVRVTPVRAPFIVSAKGELND